MPSTPMPTRFDHFTLHRRRGPGPLTLLILLLLLISCTRDEAVLLNLKSDTAIEGQAEVLTLTFSLSTADAVVQTTLEASDKRSSWTLSAKGDKGGRFTIGPLSMGEGVALPEGEYTLRVMLDDGQLLTERFSVRRP